MYDPFKYTGTPIHGEVSVSNGRSSEAIAIMKRNCEMHLSEGHDINAKDANGNTALHIAAHQNYHTMVYFLMSWGASSGVRNYEGKTPVDLAREQYAGADAARQTEEELTRKHKLPRTDSSGYDSDKPWWKFW